METSSPPGTQTRWEKAAEITQVCPSGTVAVSASSVPHLCPGQATSGFTGQMQNSMAGWEKATELWMLTSSWPPPG